MEEAASQQLSGRLAARLRGSNTGSPGCGAVDMVACASILHKKTKHAWVAVAYFGTILSQRMLVGTPP